MFKISISLGVALIISFMNIGDVVAEYPEKPVVMMVGFAQGGAVDTYARILSKSMKNTIGAPVVVRNMPGAASMIALKFVNEQKADGYTLLTQAVAFAASKTAAGTIPIDFRKRMRAIALLGEVPGALMVPKNSPFKSLKDFVDAAKSAPGKFRWAHPGRGGVYQVGPSAQFTKIGINMKDIPFKGGAPTRSAIVAEQVDAGILGVHLIRGFESKMRVLAVFDSKRDVRFPEYPTFTEEGFVTSPVISPIMLYTKAGIPDKVFDKIAKSVAMAVATKEYKADIKKSGVLDSYVGPKAASKYADGIFDLFGIK